MFALTASVLQLNIRRDIQLTSSELSPDEFFFCFNSVCTTILDSVAPLRTKHHKLTPEPWLNNTTQTLRQACIRAKRKWEN